MDDKPHDWILEGYVIAFDVDNQEYIVLEFMVPAMHQAYGGYWHKKYLNAFGAAGGVSFPQFCIAHPVSQVPAGRYSWALLAPQYSAGSRSGILNTCQTLASSIYAIPESCMMASSWISHVPIAPPPSNCHCLPTDTQISRPPL